MPSGHYLGVLEMLQINYSSLLEDNTNYLASVYCSDRCGALNVGDEILSIDSAKTSHMSVPEAMQLLATASDQIKLEILPVSHMTPMLTYPTAQNRNQQGKHRRTCGTLCFFGILTSGEVGFTKHKMLL